MIPILNPNTGEAYAIKAVNAREIYMKDFQPIKWYVDPILHEGASLLSGDPKVGKSFLALEIAIAVAGKADTILGSLPVREHGRVLYLALDDGSERRLHDRLQQLTSNDSALCNIDFVYHQPLPSLSSGLINLLDEYLSKNEYAFVILDTFGAVLDATSSNTSVYRREYQETIKLQEIAQKHRIALLIVHHTNKATGKDPVSRASGSHGLTGAVDSVLLLTSAGQRKAELQARPRDAEESVHHLTRLSNGGWTVDGDGRRVVPLDETTLMPSPVMLNEERQAVLDELLKSPKTQREIAIQLGIKPDTARKRLERMELAGQVKALPDGRYEAVGQTEIVPVLLDVPVSEVSDVSSRSAFPSPVAPDDMDHKEWVKATGPVSVPSDLSEPAQLSGVSDLSAQPTVPLDLTRILSGGRPPDKLGQPTLEKPPVSELPPVIQRILEGRS
jgi:hypothetical protein